jgi:DNA-binding GntR family transcriptional regulator
VTILDLDGAAGFRTKAEYAYEAIATAIKAQRFSPGDRLIVGEVASELDMSAVPVREALTRLAAEGLIDIDSHRGFFIPNLGVEDIVDIFETLAVLEPKAAVLALPQIGQEDIDAAEQLLEELSSLESEPARWVGGNYAFHMTLYRPCGRRRLLSAISRLATEAMGELQRHESYLDFLARSDEDHRRILDLVVARRSDELAERLRDHIERTCSELVRQKQSAG